MGNPGTALLPPGEKIYTVYRPYPRHWMAHNKDRARVANGNVDGLSRMFAGWSGLVRDATAIMSASSTDWRQLSPINSSRGERCKGHNKPQLGEEDPMCTDLSNVCSFLSMN